MKKKFVAFTLLISAIVSVTSGCIVREGYGGHRERDHHWHGERHYDRGY